MPIKNYKPTSPARRYYTGYDFKELTPGKEPEKKLTEGQSRTGGRNVHGRITSRFRGGGHKQRYRLIDWRRNKIGVPATVASIEYDPNRTARIALLHYADGEKTYILAPDGLHVGDKVVASRNADIKPGLLIMSILGNNKLRYQGNYLRTIRTDDNWCDNAMKVADFP